MGEFSLNLLILPAPHNSNDSVVMKSSKGPCDTYFGQATETEIRAFCETSDFPGIAKKVIRNLFINRKSGSFEEHFGSEKIGMVNYGRCERGRKLF